MKPSEKIENAISPDKEKECIFSDEEYQDAKDQDHVVAPAKVLCEELLSVAFKDAFQPGSAEDDLPSDPGVQLSNVLDVPESSAEVKERLKKDNPIDKSRTLSKIPVSVMKPSSKEMDVHARKSRESQTNDVNYRRPRNEDLKRFLKLDSETKTVPKEGKKPSSAVNEYRRISKDRTKRSVRGTRNTDSKEKMSTPSCLNLAENSSIERHEKYYVKIEEWKDFKDSLAEDSKTAELVKLEAPSEILVSGPKYFEMNRPKSTSESLQRDLSEMLLLKKSAGGHGASSETAVKDRILSERQVMSVSKSRADVIREKKAQITERMSLARSRSPLKKRSLVTVTKVTKDVTGRPTIRSPVTEKSPLKLDIAARRTKIEKQLKEHKITEKIPKMAPPISEEIQSHTGKEAVQEITLEENAESDNSKMSIEEKLDKPNDDKDDWQSISQKKNKILEKVMSLSRSSRRSNQSQDTPSNISRAEALSLNARYQVRLKRYQQNLIAYKNAMEEVSKTAASLNQLRENILAVSGEDPGILEFRLPNADPVAQNDVGSCTDFGAHVASKTDIAKNGAEETNINLEKENEILRTDIEELKKEIETLKQKEEVAINKQDSYFNSDLRTLSSKLEESEEKLKEYEMKLAEKDSALIHLQSVVNQQNGLPDLLQEEENKEKYENILQEWKKDKEALKASLDEVSDLAAGRKSKEVQLLSSLEKEIEKNNELKEKLQNKENELSTLGRKLENLGISSSSILELSEQLIQKDHIICELEQLHRSAQAQNKEMCRLLSTVFEKCGQAVSEDKMESWLTTGRTQSLKAMLIPLLEERISEKTIEEYNRKINQLQDQVSLLQADLEESKTYTDTLMGVISASNTWENLSDNGTANNKKNSCEGDGSDGDCNILSLEKPVKNVLNDINKKHTFDQSNRGNMNDIFVILEGKRVALMQMERRIQELEEIHSRCDQKRVRNEIRINLLETMLAQVKKCYKMKHS